MLRLRLHRRFLCPAILVLTTLASSVAVAELPQIGAQIWIEPGQTPAEIDGWFRQLAEAKMPVARIFMMWTYLEPKRDTWDFSLYDAAFASAERYHVHIVATLTPSGPPPYLGGDGTQGNGIVGSKEQEVLASEYITKVVERYKGSPALDTWLLLNEPGQPPSPELRAVSGFRAWLRSHYSSVENLNQRWGRSFASFDEVTPNTKPNPWNETGDIDWMTYWRDYHTGRLAWLAAEVRQHDPRHPLHMNPRALISNLADLSDNLPTWRPFLDSLGCSIHPAWHFGLLPRERYALGVSYINDLVSGSIAPKPYWVTELQGGNNILSALRPINPTPEEVTQWLWTSLGSGAQRVIFWLLNARREGVEAGEWSLLDFQQRPSDRLQAATAVASLLDQNAEFFRDASAVRPRVTLILSLETMTLEDHFAHSDYPGRDKQAQILETLGLYEALSRLGVPPQIKHFDDFDWRTRRSESETAILPDIRSLTTEQIAELDTFVQNGNSLFITGLTGLYDQHGKFWPLDGFPLGRITGGKLKEVRWSESMPVVRLEGAHAALPAHLWTSTIDAVDAKPLALDGAEVTATIRSLKNGGRVIWIPATIGLGAWLSDSAPLAAYLQQILDADLGRFPFRLLGRPEGCVLRVLQHGNEYVSIVTNGRLQTNDCEISAPGLTFVKTISKSVGEGSAILGPFSLPPEGTVVTLWQR